MRKVFIVIAVLTIFVLTGLCYAQGGARALFVDEDAKISSSLPPKDAEPNIKKAEPAVKYMGLSYQIFEVRTDGKQRLVTKKKIFKSGDRIRIAVKSNRSGYMTVLNVGPTGDITTLLKDKVEPYNSVNVPSKGTLRFSGPSGVETVVVMLSKKPYEGNEAVMYSDCAKIASSETRNLIVEDSMDNQYSVLSAGSGCKRVPSATRNLVVESSEGSHYGVLPNTVLDSDSVMVLNIKIQHRSK